MNEFGILSFIMGIAALVFAIVIKPTDVKKHQQKH